MCLHDVMDLFFKLDGISMLKCNVSAKPLFQ
jgi:hypothetical protein